VKQTTINGTFYLDYENNCALTCNSCDIIDATKLALDIRIAIKEYHENIKKSIERISKIEEILGN